NIRHQITSNIEMYHYSIDYYCSIEKKFFITFFKALTFSSASTETVPSCSYLTAMERSVDQTKLDFLPKNK
ncbi:MAG TPA: hypothetical protein VI146_01555, partial [Nitrososphaeraceae archaeon]